MDQVQQLLSLIDAFGNGKMADATISTRLFNDGKRIGILRNGGDIGTRRFVTAVQWLSDKWPAGVEWPPNIERPVPSVVAGEPSEAAE